jgi:arylsulfatase A-like enzyme
MFLRALVLLLLLTAALQAAERPNILLIVSDDQGYPDLSCIGTKPVQTPHLDRLASQGVRATNFYVTWPACTPSRGSLLTGQYPQRNGLYDMIRNDMVDYGHRYTPDEYAISPEMTLGLDVRDKTLGDLLRSAGYRTAMIGKWDMGQAKRFLPLQRGFDAFYGFGNNGIDYYTHERYGVPSMFMNNQRSDADKGTYATDLFKREALDFIRAKSDKPWFLYLAFNAPHGASAFASIAKQTNQVLGEAPISNGAKRADKADADAAKFEGVQAPENYIAMYHGKVANERLARYYAAVTCMDDAIGEIIALLESQGQRDNTLILFFSDNGGAGNGNNSPLRGHKSQMWEGGLRVPFLACWPGHIPGGRVMDDFISSLEVWPMFAGVSGAQTPPGLILDGFDMLPILRGEKESPRKEMFWQHRSDRAARVGNWKWVDSAQGGGLFDLASDIGETKDLSKEKPEELARVKARFEAWRSEMDAAEPRGPFRDY